MPRLSPRHPHRVSLHVEPRSALGIAQHYIRNLVYRANDGIYHDGRRGSRRDWRHISARDGARAWSGESAGRWSVDGRRNYLGIRSDERVREAQQLPEREAFPVRHGLATFLAFVAAGAVPLVPSIAAAVAGDRFVWSAILSLGVLFGVGAARARVRFRNWWTNGLEMLGLGVLVGAVSYGAGAVLSPLLH